MIYNSIVGTIGNTPIIKLNSTFKDFKGNFYGKLEAFNPGRSSKDRIGITIVDDAERSGLLKKGGTIIEATSGNTGLGLALIAIDRGYKVILVMPDKMSPEKMNLLKAIGCQVVVCPAEVKPDDPRSYYSVSKRITKETKGGFYANQYHNSANPRAHYETTGPEIWEQTSQQITHFFAGVGTGGTISGVGKYLKEVNPEIKIIGIDPKGSILSHYHKTGNRDIVAQSYKVEGVGEDIIPSTVDFDVIDDFVTVNDFDSFEWTRRLAREEGLLLGGSSGLAAAGTAKYASDYPDESMFAVILFPDTGERYLERVFSDSWLRSNRFLPPAKSIDDLLKSKAANLPPIVTISLDSTLLDALEKMRKFSISQIIVKVNANHGKIVNKSILYDSLLQKINKYSKVKSLKLNEVQFIDVNSTLSSLQTEIIEHKILIIRDSTDWVGLITIQDIMDNISIEEL